MEIGLVAYIVLVSFVLIWCTVKHEGSHIRPISLGLLNQWLKTRSDLIVFELYPDGTSSPVGQTNRDLLFVTPSSLAGFLPWIPPRSTLALCNRGISSAAVRQIHNQLVLSHAARIFWVEEAFQGTQARRRSSAIVGQ
jgi:hypothetical protein